MPWGMGQGSGAVPWWMEQGKRGGAARGRGSAVMSGAGGVAIVGEAGSGIGVRSKISGEGGGGGGGQISEEHK